MSSLAGIPKSKHAEDVVGFCQPNGATVKGDHLKQERELEDQYTPCADNNQRRNSPTSSDRFSDTEVVQRYSKLVYKIAQNLYRQLHIYVELEDLIAYGHHGLLEAHRRFDSQYNAAFSTFAYYRIRGAILDGCRQDGQIKNRSQREVTDLQTLNDYLESHYTTHQQHTGQSSFADCVDQVSETVTGAAMTLVLRQQGLHTTKPEQHRTLEKHQLSLAVRKAVELLEENEKTVLTRYYFNGETMQEIADSMGLSKSWVCRIHARAIKSLRRLIDEDGEPVQSLRRMRV